MVFQGLVGAIESALSTREGVTVRSPVFLKDRSGGRREHDILITAEFGTHQVLTSVECKDQSRAVTVPQVEAFAKKCERTGVHLGVMVSSSGFTQTARAAAAEMNIRCQEIETIADVDWSAGVLVQRVKRHLIQMMVHFPPQAELTYPVRFYELEGGEIPESAMKKRVNLQLNETGHSEAGRDGGAVWEQVFLPASDIYVIDQTGRRHDPSELDFMVLHQSEIEILPVAFHRYRGAQATKELATVRFGETEKGSFIITPEADEGLGISFTPDDPYSAKWRYRKISGGQTVEVGNSRDLKRTVLKKRGSDPTTSKEPS